MGAQKIMGLKGSDPQAQGQGTHQLFHLAAPEAPKTRGTLLNNP